MNIFFNVLEINFVNNDKHVPAFEQSEDLAVANLRSADFRLGSSRRREKLTVQRSPRRILRHWYYEVGKSKKASEFISSFAGGQADRQKGRGRGKSFVNEEQLEIHVMYFAKLIT